MTVTATHLDMHREHENWLNDNSMWRDDINLWRAESERALEQLGEIQAALRRLAASIDSHQDALDRHVAQIRQHEHSLSEFEQAGHGDTVEMLAVAKTHRKAAADHASEQKAHEQLKHELHSVMARWNALLRRMTSPA
jgi:hypothetical protein